MEFFENVADLNDTFLNAASMKLTEFENFAELKSVCSIELYPER